MIAIKTVGSSGQISLGKEFAGRHVMIDQLEPGVWLLKIGSFIPDSERWLHQPEVESVVNEAVAWADATPPRETDPDDLASQLDEL